MVRINKINHTSKKEFPREFQEFYLEKPRHLPHFPVEFNETCIMVPPGAIDLSNSVFCDPKRKKVDEIYHCKKLGLIENKGGNYSSTQLIEKFTNHKDFIERKYKEYTCCKIGYCVIKAERLSEKLKREFKVTKNKELYFYNHPKHKKFKVGACQVYFVKKR